MPETKNSVVMMPVVESSVSWDGTSLPAYPAGTPLVTILRATIPPHAKLEMHRHRPVNAGVVLRGELIVVAEDAASEHSVQVRESSRWSAGGITVKTGGMNSSSW